MQMSIRCPVTRVMPSRMASATKLPMGDWGLPRVSALFVRPTTRLARAATFFEWGSRKASTLGSGGMSSPTATRPARTSTSTSSSTGGGGVRFSAPSSVAQAETSSATRAA
jgi:hypothetical protein